MLPCRGRLSLASLMGSRFSSGLWVWPWVRGLAGLGLTSGPKCSVCISLSLSPFPLPQPLALSPSYVCLSLTLSSVPHLSMSGWGRGSWLVYLWVTLYFGLQVPHLWWGWGSPPPHPSIHISLLFCSWLTAPICVSPVSVSQSLHFSRTLRPPAQTGPQPPGDTAAPSPVGGGGGKEQPPHLAPALPPPSQPARLYKANRPLYSAGRAPRGHLIWCGGSAGLWGRR